jgi:hypothetical protein
MARLEHTPALPYWWILPCTLHLLLLAICVGFSRPVPFA